MQCTAFPLDSPQCVLEVSRIFFLYAGFPRGVVLRWAGPGPKVVPLEPSHLPTDTQRAHFRRLCLAPASKHQAWALVLRDCQDHARAHVLVALFPELS